MKFCSHTLSKQLGNSVEQKPAWEADSQGIIQKFITVFTRAH
jgi:hypothetical protein